MGKLTMSMAIFKSYVKLPEGIWQSIWLYPVVVAVKVWPGTTKSRGHVVEALQLMDGEVKKMGSYQIPGVL